MKDPKTFHVHFRLEEWQGQTLKKYKVDIPEYCRRQAIKKIRDLMNDPTLVVEGGDDFFKAPYVQAWQRIMPIVTSELTLENFQSLKNSEYKLKDLKVMVASPVMTPEELENLGKFLQGEKISEEILMYCIDEHLKEEVKIS